MNIPQFKRGMQVIHIASGIAGTVKSVFWNHFSEQYVVVISLESGRDVMFPAPGCAVVAGVQ